jgi:phospholipid/cholesterol/gamma-HCH transport system substrate-binding protein
MSRMHLRATVISLILTITAAGLAGCGWRGLNSLPLPGTEGGGHGSFTVQAQMANVANIQPNSRVRIADVTVGHVTKIERQDWHALVTMALDSDVDLPADTTAKLGQTSLLGTLHIELSPPNDEPPHGKLHNGSLIPLMHARAYPTTEQTLAAISMLLNGGGLGEAQDITKALFTAFAGREQDLRSLIHQLDEFVDHLDAQKGDIIAATDSVNKLVGQFADRKPMLDNALRTIPDALAVLKDQRENLVNALDAFGRFGAVTASSINQTKEAIVAEVKDLGPILESLANSGPALTRSLSMLATYPWPFENVRKWFRGDYANLTLVLDLTLSRIDTGLFTGTRWECNLTELELQWGRTIGQLPSPCTAGGPHNLGNPLIAPYHINEGP